jgi:hypothetical protein
MPVKSNSESSIGKANQHGDRALGTDRNVTRRDFLNAALLASGSLRSCLPVRTNPIGRVLQIAPLLL